MALIKDIIQKFSKPKEQKPYVKREVVDPYLDSLRRQKQTIDNEHEKKALEQEIKDYHKQEKNPFKTKDEENILKEPNRVKIEQEKGLTLRQWKEAQKNKFNPERAIRKAEIIGARSEIKERYQPHIRKPRMLPEKEQRALISKIKEKIREDRLIKKEIRVAERQERLKRFKAAYKKELAVQKGFAKALRQKTKEQYKNPYQGVPRQQVSSILNVENGFFGTDNRTTSLKTNSNIMSTPNHILQQKKERKLRSSQLSFLGKI